MRINDYRQTQGKVFGTSTDIYQFEGVARERNQTIHAL